MPGKRHCDEYEQCAESRQWGEHQEDAEGGGYSLAAFEIQPDGEAVAEQRGCRGEHHGCRAVLGESCGEPDGGRAFGYVQKKGEDSRCGARDSRDVGSADVAAARLADVACCE